ncbi:shikimate dehydrogenase family protein [Pelagibacterium lacus]|uniref:shikimate dehydrogenase (NADP(+)) n=1 Tax=Pelagibacterium lacus TaxID=2282655 RepID=A0A369WD84_9HYPH|nr:shikimate dehydrogenase [Pelagibacterium lacus]RDE10061.1 shikimate dehydrogenase [Pelagibacterium lacus]
MVDGVAISGTTRLMGLIGDPIAQVRTPTAINAIFAKAGADIACVPLHVPAADLATVWQGLKAMPNLIGFGVTLPHKQAALALCDSIDPLAARVGAVNLVRRERDGSFRGYQFDGVGFVGGLRAKNIPLEGRDAVMVGAGGAAMAIAFALLEAGIARLTIANRTPSKAEALVQAINSAAGRNFAVAGPVVPERGALVINATALGMAASDPLPFPPDVLDETMTVAEVVAKPEITALLEAARARNAQIHSGLEMIHGQVGLTAEHFMAIWA